jgi:hypothetical protein
MPVIPVDRLGHVDGLREVPNPMACLLQSTGGGLMADDNRAVLAVYDPPRLGLPFFSSGHLPTAVRKRKQPQPLKTS